MIRIVSFKICPFVQRVTALLEAKRVPYEMEYISLSNKPAWFLDVSPNGQVPLLITEDGDVLFGSEAIIEYIDEGSAPLSPGQSPVQRALDRAWSYQAAKHYMPQCGTMQSADRDRFRERVANLRNAFEKAESHLGEGPYFNGAIMGNVDIAWLPLLHRAQIVKQRRGYDFLADFPRMQAWQRAMSETGIAGKSVADDFEDVFSDFYLNDTTFLGRGANFDEAVINDRPAITRIGE